MPPFGATIAGALYATIIQLFHYTIFWMPPLLVVLFASRDAGLRPLFFQVKENLLAFVNRIFLHGLIRAPVNFLDCVRYKPRDFFF